MKKTKLFINHNIKMNHRRGLTMPALSFRLHNISNVGSPFDEYATPKPILREKRILKMQTQKIVRKQ